MNTAEQNEVNRQKRQKEFHLRQSMREIQWETLEIQRLGGWEFEGYGSDESINIFKGDSHAYIRADGAIRKT